MDELDKDYDEVPPETGGDGIQEGELEDEQQDWRLLKSMSSKNTIPKRGDKEYEPVGSAADSNALEESREAMYTALQGERKHTSKVHVSGVWCPDVMKTRVNVARGPHFKSIGKANSTGVIWLLPEEVIYLVERGSMSLYNARGDSIISLQGCYAACLPGCGHDRYLIYAYLKRLGYIVQRAGTFDDSDTPATPVYNPTWRANRLWIAIREKLMQAWKQLNGLLTPRIAAFGPVIRGGVWRSYSTIFKALQIVPFYSHIPDVQKKAPPAIARPPFRIAYNAWKPRPSFKKSNPGEPDFRVVVVNAQTDKMPTLSQLDALFAPLPVAHGSDATMQQRLKQGYKNVIFGIVDYGITTFVSFGDVSFGDEQLYEQERSPRSKPGARQSKAVRKS